ncbi:MAG: hypothetical protein M3N93_14045 [Acidobacteriota bacterium]|nr:hypothetical protein [Acidobacteriota bacterium]
MNSARYLCSHLVNLRIGAREFTVNLEEIAESGAVLESEEAVTADTKAEIRCAGAFFAGSIVEAEEHDFGWRLTMNFSPLTPWRLEEFEPAHLIPLKNGTSESP